MSRFNYPDHPGAKVGGTSEEAAKAFSRTACALRVDVLKEIAASPNGLSADAVAHRLGRSVLSIRPRVSELFRAGEIRRSDRRVKNASGLNANVWVVAPPLPGPGGDK